ncbi:sigma-54-dependent transcriptional regulator [Flavobacterium capsici]|uniref:Sigma-54 dependent transcriptional regulator n=1 Tax=Flavobacterium capsici TaxID=3075618 RepID=A0AA96J1Z9_9FLAO|nr:MULTISPECIES: sigma-54 dependent transcriptional regulator [unclassified Flavobacterium]WNM18480.1 sigma-54 dependent transcriptional regulator [Flavobacterium sp. PMR2A8]WNM22531.1 sigma-54 dependent transcriptional regulator [Flavobacterium sp. PMTSA4]
MKLKKENILIVDDNYDMLELLQRHLKSFNFHTYKASSVVEAIEVLKTTSIDLLITDLQMPEINGIELIRYTSEHFPSIPKLVITGFPSVDTAINAVKSGALDYLIKPFTGEEFKKAIQNCLKNDVLKPNQAIERKNLKETFYSGIVGSSEEHFKLIDVIERVKDNRVTVLIEGESGTGKELIARAIHYNGRFAAQPFITVNCGGIPESLLESELFGYVKGAFTGANETKKGLFHAAEGGTIFLDEIGNASLAVQSRLLRVLQEKEITMVGSQKPQKIEVRIISATNSNLQEMMKNGTFREDLYYRLNIVSIESIPLRNRKADLLPLINNFIKKYEKEYGKSNITITPKAIAILTRHDWPGNVRELENIIQRLIVLCDNTIDVDLIPNQLKYKQPSETFHLKPLHEIEKAYILKVLSAVHNNKTKAAEILQIDRKTLRQKLL